MSVLFYVDGDDDKKIESYFRQLLNKTLPAETLVVQPEPHSPETIDYVVTWKPPPGFFTDLVNLKAIFSVGAGVDHLLNHAGLPADVPIARLLDAGMGEKMSEYVLYAALHAHRKMQHYHHSQQEQIWAEDQTSANAADVNIGILGFGTLGRCVADRLHLNGYSVVGWSRSEKFYEGFSTYHGVDGLDQLLQSVNILVCLLPHTALTEGLLNQSLFDRAKPGLFLINVGRGALLSDSDLITALDSGQLSGAMLDVTNPEPLPPGHPFWLHPRITLTPHISAPTQIKVSVEQIVHNLQRHKSSGKLEGLVNRSLGY